MAYTNENGNITKELGYDAWGRRRNPDTWACYEFSNRNASSYDNGFTGHEHIDWFDMINMDGRMYDPVVGRFMSPDPYVQAPDFTQSLNRYAYCINNSLSLTDPSGYNWIESTFSAIVGIAVGIETGGLASGVYGAIVGGALGGASASLMSSIFNGANLWQTAKSTFTGAFWGAASGTVNFEIGNIENVFSRIAAHTAAEGAMEGIRGGHVEHGLLMGLTSSTGGALIEKYSFHINNITQVFLNATLTGLVTELGGGKFCNGAMTGAFYAMFNDLIHRGPTYKQLKKLYEIEAASIESMNPEEFYESLGGEIAEKAKIGKWENACAARLCYAMNNAGMKIPYWKGVTLKDQYGNNYITLASDMIKYFRRIWGQGIHCKNNWILKNGIIGQTGFEPPVSGHVDIIYNRNAAGGALEYFLKNATTEIWKYGR